MSGERSLCAEHAAMLRASAISDEVADARGYFTATRRTELADLGFARYQQITPALVVPVWGVDGEIVNYQCRPDCPRVDAERGRQVKYETVAGSSVRLDVPPPCRPTIGSPVGPLWITEGVKKADALASAGVCTIGLLGVDCFHCEDWDRVSLDERHVYVAYDSDVMVKRGVHGALDRLAKFVRAKGADVLFVYLPTVEGKVGVDDFLAGGHSLEDLYALAEDELRARPPEEKPKRAAALPTAYLLDLIERLLRRFVRFPSGHEPAALALFVMHTWVLEAAVATPYMLVIAPEKRSGKTRVLEVAELAVREPIRAANVTAAGVFQAIEKWTPTLLVDEIDAVFRSKSEQAEALRGVLNAGNRRGSHVIRGSQDGEPARFGTFCPKMMAGINNGRLPDTIRDRSIMISMKRRRPGEDVEDLFPAELAEQLAELHRLLEDWAAENVERLAVWRRPGRVAGLDDRLQEAWDPLLAIADLAEAGWPEKARQAATALRKGSEDPSEQAHGHMLIEALRGVFGGEAGLSSAALSSRAICKALNDEEELPFAGYSGGVGIAPRDLAKLLRPYEIKSSNVRIGAEQAKGYRRDDFEDAWRRYTPGADPSEDPSRPSQASQANAHRGGDGTDGTDGTDAETAARDARASTNGAGAERADALCRNPAHRDSDWALPIGEIWICGVCHPPAVGLAGIVYRNGGPPA